MKSGREPKHLLFGSGAGGRRSRSVSGCSSGNRQKGSQIPEQPQKDVASLDFSENRDATWGKQPRDFRGARLRVQMMENGISVNYVEGAVWERRLHRITDQTMKRMETL
jgi:hypothetical protein